MELNRLIEQVRRISPYMDAYDAGPVLELCDHTEALEKELAAVKAKALRDAAEELETLGWVNGRPEYRAGPSDCAEWLRECATKEAGQ